MAAPVSFRQRVLISLTECLESISTANGYQHDMAGKVFRGRIKFGATDPIPMLSILEAPIPLDNGRVGNEYAQSKSLWELLIQGFIDDDYVHPSDPAQNLMAEVKAALVKSRRQDRGNNILGMGGSVYEMRIGHGSVRPADESNEKGFFWLTLTLGIVENLEDPYA